MYQELFNHLAFIYGEETADSATNALVAKLELFQGTHPDLQKETTASTSSMQTISRVSEKDVMLITYGDMVQEEGIPPLQTLGKFLKLTVSDAVNTVHILPFYPYSSDDGFSVIDYRAVNPDLGSWADVAALGEHFRLMFDAVINHISAESNWFQGFLAGKRPFTTYFTVPNMQADWSQVFRPRALPLFTEFGTNEGIKSVWTTFSTDQIDLNYASPDLLLAVLDTLLFYVSQGAEFIRLDAIAFIWKEPGTTCIHLPQAHRIIQLMRSVLNIIAPRVAIITETNVPHKENISYFGNGHNEAQMVYNFPLPPLTLHAFHTGNAETLSTWADSLSLPSDTVTFFNFLASHDGIGLTPARGILSETAVSNMAARVEKLGGHVSYRSQPDGGQSPYELNINYLDALGDPEQNNEENDLIARRFLASQTIMLALQGVPGIYFHSLFGSRNWQEGVEQTGRNRTINRQKLTISDLNSELGTENHLRRLVFSGYKNLLDQRRQQAAFHPNSAQEVLSCHESVFALLRTADNGRSTILCLHNVANKPVSITLDQTVLNIFNGEHQDIISGESFRSSNLHMLTLAPYQCLWVVK